MNYKEKENNFDNKDFITREELNKIMVKQRNDFTVKYDKLKTVISYIMKKELMVKVKNGEEKNIKLSDAVSDIWEATQVIRDINKIYLILKRYKFVVIFLIALFYNYDKLFEIITTLIK